MKIGLIGCGKQAPKHISGLSLDESIEIVVCDIEEERARTVGEAHGLEWTTDVDQLLADTSISAVDIATPTRTHAPLVRKAIAENKHYFCEKPFCEDVADARQIAEESVRCGLIGMVGYVYRYAPVFEKAYELTGGAESQPGPLGKPVSALFRLGGRGDHELWKHRKASSGGAISEMMVHMLDLAIWYFGEPVEGQLLSCDLLRPQREINGERVEADAEDFVLARFLTPAGLPIYIQADLVTPSFSQHAEIQFQHGSYYGSIQADNPSYVFSTRDAGPYKAGKHVLKFGQVNLFERQMATFVNHVRTGEQVSSNSVEDSLHLMNALNLLNA